MSVRFGTSGLRGLASDLLAGAAAAHAFAFCRYLQAIGAVPAGGRVALGRDRRDSSPALTAQVAGAIVAAGFTPIDCGEVPTPALATWAFARGAAAIMITGSHVPADRNGLKFYRPGAEISKADEMGITTHLPPDGTNFTSDLGFSSGPDRAAECLEAWHERYGSLLPSSFLASLRIGVFDHSSVATGPLARLLSGFGAQIVRFGQSGTFVPVDTEAVDPRILTDFRRQAANSHLDVILSTDADGDRPLVADETGTPLPGDLLGWLAALWLGATAIATPVTSNSAIADRPGLHIVRTRIGSPFVIAVMDAAIARGEGLVCGFEANGGFLLGSPASLGSARLSALPTRDSFLPIMAVLHALATSRLPASSLLALAGFRASAADRLPDYAPSRSAALIARLEDPAFAARFLAGLPAIMALDRTDGFRFTLADGAILHFRPSGNAPEMRCYCEAATAAAAASLLADGLQRLRSV